MIKIVVLTDYKGHFESKWHAVPYRSGMNLELLKKYFNDLNYEFEAIKLSAVNFKNDVPNSSVFLYTASEDKDFKYKDYIEDIVLGVQESGGHVVPAYKYLRAYNNKVFMEILRESTLVDKNLKSYYWSAPSTDDLNTLSFPIVLKKSAGAMGTGVHFIKNKKQLLDQLKKINQSKSLNNIKNYIKDSIRPYKHKGYKKESLFREKFILQEFVPNLKSDFKVLAFGERYYIFERPVRKNDFRASGSGHGGYRYGSAVEVHSEIFDYAEKVHSALNVPNASLDICSDGEKFLLFEFQALSFGSVGQHKSDGYYVKKKGEWTFISEELELEKVYVDSIHYYLQKNNIL